MRRVVSGVLPLPAAHGCGSPGGRVPGARRSGVRGAVPAIAREAAGAPVPPQRPASESAAAWPVLFVRIRIHGYFRYCRYASSFSPLISPPGSTRPVTRRSASRRPCRHSGPTHRGRARLRSCRARRNRADGRGRRFQGFAFIAELLFQPGLGHGHFGEGRGNGIWPGGYGEQALCFSGGTTLEELQDVWSRRANSEATRLYSL